MTNLNSDLVVRMRNGDIRAFSELIGEYANLVYGIAYSKLGDFHIAQDIAQEVFIKLFRKIDQLKEPEKVSSWLYAVTTRECIDWFRSNKYEAAYELTEKMDAPQLETTEDRLLKKEFHDEVWNALNTLSEGNRIVTILYYIDDYKMKEIGEFLGISVEAVESRLRRSRTLLKKEMLSMVNENLNQNKLNDDFKKKVFQDERMSETQFRRIAMGESDFDDIDMYKTNFYNINLENSKFNNINMSKTVFHDINMHQVKFDDVGLWEIEVCNSEMGGAHFRDITLQEGKVNTFERCDLNGTSFLNCNLSNVDIKDCNISGLKINGISIDVLLKNYDYASE